MAGSEVDAALRATAGEALDAFERIATAATARLAQRGQHLGAMANVNAATAGPLARSMRDSNDGRELTCATLQREPAVARLVLVDDDDKEEVVYITAAGTVDPSPVPLCSYMSPKGRLASFAVGQGDHIILPGGARKAYDVLEKITFKPLDGARGWDSQPAIQHRHKLPPRTIQSLRAVLEEDGFSSEEIEAFELALRGASEPSAVNITEGLQHQTLTAMQLRAAAILDRFQDKIFRLPIDRQIAVLGPPGTGKTTTLVKRLRQRWIGTIWTLMPNSRWWQRPTQPGWSMPTAGSCSAPPTFCGCTCAKHSGAPASRSMTNGCARGTTTCAR